jgi:hypothetical protein
VTTFINCAGGIFGILAFATAIPVAGMGWGIVFDPPFRFAARRPIVILLRTMAVFAGLSMACFAIGSR